MMHGRVLNVSDLLSQHAGDELAIFTLPGEFDMIHPPDLVERYVPDAIFGGVHRAQKAKGAAQSFFPVATDQGDAVANLEA